MSENEVLSQGGDRRPGGLPGELHRHWIEEGKSPRGGWSRAQLKLVGVPWPPPKGWRAILRDRDDIPETVQHKFVQMRDGGPN